MEPITDQNPDLLRMQQEYARRTEEGLAGDRYSFQNPAHRWIILDRQKEIRKLLKTHQPAGLADLQILEIGCGSGGVMDEFIQLGAEPGNLVGVDLLLDRLKQASTSMKNECSWVNANGQHLPFLDGTFHLTLQFTAFSSILDPETKKDMAAEILRVLKPGGSIVWYDFIWNPANPQTKGIGLKEIKKLFPGCNLTPARITLAPPLVRALLPRFPRLAGWLSSLKILNSHLLVWIQKPG